MSENDNKKKNIRIVFDSQFMKNDTIELYGVTPQEARQEYFDWWKRYGKGESYALQQLVLTEEIKG